MRMNFDESQSLEQLVQAYVENKNELDSYKRICDEENKQIKTLMEEMELSEVRVNDKKVLKRIITTRYDVNELKMLQVLKKYNVPATKTVEVIDEEALENFLYHADPNENKELLAELDGCKKAAAIVSLKLVNAKKMED